MDVTWHTNDFVEPLLVLGVNVGRCCCGRRLGRGRVGEALAAADCERRLNLVGQLLAAVALRRHHRKYLTSRLYIVSVVSGGMRIDARV